MNTKPNVVIIPGNGDSHVETDNWYAWLKRELVKRGYPVTMTDMPDPIVAHMNIWLPYLEQHLITSDHTIVIGHSSGAVATLRYLEHHRLTGAILVSCNYTDLGFADEKEAGWYDAPWQWEQIKRNAGWIVQLHSDNDPYFDTTEPKYIQTNLGSELRILPNRGHFMTDHNPTNNQFPEIIEIIEIINAKLAV